MRQKNILLISTGGTIAGQVAKNKKEGESIKTADQFSELLKDTVNSIKEVHNTEVIIDHEPLREEDGQDCDLDSSDILPYHWIELSNLIKKNYDKYDAFIITHGTNTMGYTSAALSFAFGNLGKPIILTGSQVPAGMPGTDGIMNLENALRLSAIEITDNKDGSKHQIMGVLAVFGSHIISGTRVKKNTEFDYDAFKSFGTSGIGRIGRIIDINKQNLNKHNTYLSQMRPPANNSNDLICENKFDTNIVSLTEFPGMNYKIFKTLVDNHDIKGFILRSFGAGDASGNLQKGFEYLKNREIPIVITSQAPNGNSNFEVNEPGRYLQKHELAIPAHDMSIESQTTKLAWLLAKRKNGEITYNQLFKMMLIDMRGEINRIWEVKM